MIMNNENRKLSRIKKRRIARRIELDDKMKALLNKIKTERKKRNKHNEKIKFLEIEMVKIKYSNPPNKLQNALKELSKIHVINKNLHEIKQEILSDYNGECGMVGRLKIGDQIRQPHIRFRNIDVYQSYINAIDQDYESEDAFFNGYIHKLNTPQFNIVKRNQNGNGYDFKHEIFECRGKKSFIPTKGYCFVKCTNFITGEDYKEHYIDFIQNEKRRSNFMTKARIRPFCRANNNNLG